MPTNFDQVHKRREYEIFDRIIGNAKEFQEKQVVEKSKELFPNLFCTGSAREKTDLEQVMSAFETMKKFQAVNRCDVIVGTHDTLKKLSVYIEKPKKTDDHFPFIHGIPCQFYENEVQAMCAAVELISRGKKVHLLTEDVSIFNIDSSTDES